MQGNGLLMCREREGGPSLGWSPGLSMPPMCTSPANGHLTPPPLLGVEKTLVFGIVLSFYSDSTLSHYLKTASLRTNISKHCVFFGQTMFVEQEFNLSLFLTFASQIVTRIIFWL